MFHEWRELKLRLDALRISQLEKALGGVSPLVVFQRSQETMPPLSDLLLILHYSLIAYNHSKKMEDTYVIYDNFVAEGGDVSQLIMVLIEVFKVSGLIPKDVDADKVKE